MELSPEQSRSLPTLYLARQSIGFVIKENVVVVAAAADEDDNVVGCGVKVDLLKHDHLPNSVSFLSIRAVNRTAWFYVGPTWWEQRQMVLVTKLAAEEVCRFTVP